MNDIDKIINYLETYVSLIDKSLLDYTDSALNMAKLGFISTLRRYGKETAEGIMRSDPSLITIHQRTYMFLKASEQMKKTKKQLESAIRKLQMEKIHNENMNDE